MTRILNDKNPGNIESTKPKNMSVIHHSTERWLTCMIYDGVLERFPRLKVGIIELGANRVLLSLANPNTGASLLGRFDPGLKRQRMKPNQKHWTDSIVKMTETTWE